jgi:hypothetical protein
MSVELGSQILSRLSFVEQPAPDPVGWIGEQLGEHPWSKQCEVLAAVAAHRRVAIPAAHAVGKSWLAARAAAHFIASWPIGEAFVITTAPSQSQVATILWRELRRVHRRARLPGRIVGSPSQPQQWLIGDEIVGIGRKSADGADPEQASAAMQGIHARRILIVVDEAGGVPSWLWDAVESMLTNVDARVLAIGNPAARSPFERVCAPGSGWHTMRIAAGDTPAFTGEDVPQEVLAALVSQTWVDEVTRRFGPDSSYVTARVHARFPESAEDSLVEAEWIREAQARDLSAAASSTPGTLATDVARTGRDRTIALANRGGQCRVVHEARGHDLMRTTGHVVDLARNTPRGSRLALVVDESGLGGGVVDRLREQRFSVLAFNGAHRAHDPDRFVNRRAEVYWALRELLRTGALDLDAADDDLALQLGEIRWKLDSKGRIQIESKDAMRARGVQSPDRADALMMSVASRAWEPVPEEDELQRALRAAERRRRRRQGEMSFEQWISTRPPIPW